MIRIRTMLCAAAATTLALSLAAGSAHAQLGRQQGLLDPNVATEAQLTAVPGLTADLVRTILQRRPFANITGLDSLLGQTLSVEQRTALYRRVFIHVDLNAGSREEILLIPGAGRRMAREFAEYRPYAAFDRFRREIGKYVDAREVARLERYVTIR